MSFLEALYHERMDLAKILTNPEYAGIRNIVEELYPDSAHFIYELLQNAEDSGAKTATFTLSKGSLAFEHNGRSFTEDDVRGITNIGKGTKKDQEDKIGQFGVGFKAVFAYSETPRIWSPSFCFEISDLVLPKTLGKRPELAHKTRFEFPFNNPKKHQEEAYEEVKSGLLELSETTLLFLSSLESIQWSVEGEDVGEVLRIHHSENHIEVLRRLGGSGATDSEHYLRFSDQIEGMTGKTVSIAYELELLPKVEVFSPEISLSKQFKISPANPGRVAVFFPAEKETSELRFHVHAPFVPELSRASIKETKANIPLFQKLALLSAESLKSIKAFGLLTTDFLGVLPNTKDQLPARYCVIRNEIIKRMNDEPLTPTHSRAHAPAKTLIQSPAALKSLLSKADLAALLPSPERAWAAAAAQTNSNADRFLGSLQISNWGVDEFFSLIQANTTAPYKPFIEWMKTKDASWTQELYALLHDHIESAGYRKYGLVGILRNLHIVRLASSEYVMPARSFFPGDKGSDDQIPRVDSGVYSSGRSKVQQDNSRKLLVEIGVREVGEREEVEIILAERYKNAPLRPKKGDLERFMSLFEKDPSSAALLKDYYIFPVAGGGYVKPADSFLDSPHLETGLTEFYTAINTKGSRRQVSTDISFDKAGMKRFSSFAVGVGSLDRLPIIQTNCWSNPRWDYLRQAPGERYTATGRNIDYTVENLTVALQSPSLRRSKLIWKTMISLSGYPSYLRAEYRNNESNGSRYSASQLVCILKSSKWVPQGEDSFVVPADARRELLPPGFSFDLAWPWLSEIGFGASAQQKADERRKRTDIANVLGIKGEEALDRCLRFNALPADEQDRILSERERLAQIDLPDNSPRNPSLRSTRISEEASEAAEKESEHRTRAVQIGRDAVKVEAEQYLRSQYTNDGEMFCQICQAPMPFRTHDGTHYFERVDVRVNFARNHSKAFLALCPNHSAMYRFANDSLEDIESRLLSADRQFVEILLAGKTVSIYFTKTHLGDLRAIIDTERKASAKGNGRDE